MATLSLDDIKNSIDLETQTIDVPEWNGSLEVKGLTKAEQVKIRKAQESENGLSTVEFEKMILIAGIVEPKVDEKSIDVLYEKSATVVDRVLSTILNTSGLTEGVQQEIADEFQE
tara:strand:+ start:293 stop:637 length:345 start_codon:yes stop_codon:yes gene_type:complete